MTNIQLKRINHQDFDHDVTDSSNQAIPEILETAQAESDSLNSQSLLPEDRLIHLLLIYPGKSAKILAANQQLLNSNLVRKMEAVATQMNANGSTEAANFLRDLASELRHKIVTLESEKIKQQSLEVYQNLIGLLLIYPYKATKILESNQKLLDAGLVQMLESVAAQMTANGSTEAAEFLQDLAVHLRQEIARTLGLVKSPQEHPSLIAERKQPKKFKLWWGCLLLLLAGLPIMITSQKDSKSLANFSQASADQSQNNPQSPVQTSGTILPVETLNLKSVNSYQVSRAYTGTVAASRISELGFERSGKLIDIGVDQGDLVKTGTPLAYLDNQNLLTQEQELLAERAQIVSKLKELQTGARPETIAAAKASVRDLEQQLELARNKNNRREALYTEGAISREQFEEADSSQSVLQARLDQAQSKLDELLAGTRSERIEGQQALIQKLDATIANLRIELDKSTLKAPFDGTISARQVDEGTVVSSGESILRLVEDGALEVRIGVPITATEQLKPGKSLTVKIAQKTYQARVTSILPELDSSTRTLTVVLTFDTSAKGKVFPGQLARLELSETIDSSGFWLPTTALVRGKRGLWSCYVIGKSTSKKLKQSFPVERRDVEVLHTVGDRILVRGTLQPDDQLITSGNHRLVPGQLVKIQ